MYLACFVEFCCFELGVPNEHTCGASPTSRKARPWIFGTCTLRVLTIFVVFNLVCPMSMLAALRRTQEKHAPGILEHVPCVFCRFLLFLVSGVSFGCYLVVIYRFWAKCFDNRSLHVGLPKSTQRDCMGGFLLYASLLRQPFDMLEANPHVPPAGQV